MEKELRVLKDVRQLALKMQHAGLQEIEWRGARWSVRLRFPNDAVAKTAVPPLAITVEREASLLPVCSPIPGRLLLSHPSHGDAFIQPGQRIKPHALLALVRVGPLYLPVRSPVDATVESIVAQADQQLEYGSEIALLLPLTPAVGKL
ncbi:hypothetical protein DZA65_03848 [Dickeya dianthicola]|uniref:Acetyl-CoA carboxylase biotin carboxyl carrier protein subunit n=1 Tax=Dickeya dianthicola TaxID=204039 RepID=A0AAP2D5F4_9GAMM|nr:biotin attachment protein [Dickeya dianthicola]ATO34868.1 hypothetical protein DDI_3700 [Dickeya dianthicola RNS04.9]AYC20697.1 hypothetical protein DZA65_03848 [Dickeya dianthicola]MBI0439682.1 acetyl-CoA carboxylase biotin carboxyl carrier protein subunit [Dickeya dianthicola]MBI0450182.1 acetyl-CoA carboxylase biotin carboxyl carrier protein subunit [Dickeya dianthicola]MBI0454735.1 acetyl-CoA carboxylase biotin carboxyl carrier protein subunit [Dickeya dianthicola]